MPTNTALHADSPSDDVTTVGRYSASHLGAHRGEEYDRGYSRGAPAFYWHYFERPYLEDLFGRIKRSGLDRYLDFACGTGRILEVGAAHFSDAVGVDVSEAMLAQARQKVPQARFVICNVLATPLDLGKFDVISSFRFLLHATPAERQGALNWLRSSISERGVLLVNNHCNAWSARGIAARLKNLVRRAAPRATLKDREVKRLLADHGFAITETFGFGLAPSLGQKLIMPRAALRVLESTFPFRSFAENRIYVCRPA